MTIERLVTSHRTPPHVMSVEKFKHLVTCLDDMKFIEGFQDILFDNKIEVPSGVYIRICKQLREAYSNEKYRKKLVTKILLNIRKHEPELRRSA
jgi:hypothetical protein